MRVKRKGLESLKSKYGLAFISPWIIGLLLFFIFPIAKSIYYVFCNVSLTSSGIKSVFTGFENFNYIINKDPQYMKLLTESLGKIAYSLPIIVILSMLLAIILNTKFKGRIFFRGLFFLPVIIATGVVMELIFQTNSGDVASIGVDESVASNMIDIDSIIGALGIPTQISEYLIAIFGNLFELVWSSGIQIILFVSGLQTIPDLLYEVAKVEGCTKWEEFWYITFPMLSRVTILVIVFTIIELLTAKTNVLMSMIFQILANLEYGTAAAMAWFYFLIVGLVLGAFMFILNKFCFARWR